MKRFSLIPAFVVLLFAGAVSLPAQAGAQTYYSNYTPSYSYTQYGSYGSGCVSLTSNLSYGSQGGEVSQLQQFLVNQGYPGVGSWMVTGYFGDATIQAVRYFQQTAGVPVTGYVDAATRSAIQSRSCFSGQGGSYGNTYSYDYGSYNNYPYLYTPTYPTYQNYPYSYPSYYAYPDPEIEDVDGPSSLDENELGVWKVEIDAPVGSSVTISVDWDDDDRYNYNYNYGYGGIPGYGSNVEQSVQVPASKVVTFSHAYRKEGRYEVRFRVRGSRKSDTETVSVRVQEVERLELDSLRPDEGEVGDTITIKGSGFTNSNTVHFGVGGESDVSSRNDGSEIRFEIPKWISQCDLLQYGYYCGSQVQPVFPGVYPIYVSNSKGTSNILYFKVED